MTRWTLRAAAALLGGLCLVGCSKPGGQAEAPGTTEEAPAPAAARPGSTEGGGSAPAAAPLVRDALHQPFEKAARDGDSPPDNIGPPASQTATGKSAFKLMAAVRAEWDRVRFTAPSGKKVHYTAKLTTAMGEIEIALLPELAPNHVRNFVALARVGYYDGLTFDRTESQKSGGLAIEQLLGGSPDGGMNPPPGSIGYWLEPEFQPGDRVSHEVGAVGACREEAPNSAACRFYVNLLPAPHLDGTLTIFGKVVKGLDVARTIYTQPVHSEDQDQDGARRPANPVVIQRVTIHTTER